MTTSGVRGRGIRGLWTFGLPLAYLAIAPRLTLPGLDRAALGGASPTQTTVFALGLVPVLGAYALVELVAILVPRLARLRHNNPAGRQKLDGAARFVAVALALVQAFTMASSLAKTVDDAPGTRDGPPEKQLAEAKRLAAALH